MDLPKGAIVAVVDGERLNLFRNEGAGSLSLTALPHGEVDTGNMGSGGRHQSSSANPDDRQQDEDAFAAGVAALLNRRVLEGGTEHLLIVAAPRTLGELRKHYHAKLAAALVGELAKDLTGHSVAGVEQAIRAG